MRDFDKDEELIELIVFGQKRAIANLISENRNVNVRNKFGQSAALMAAKQNNLDILKMLTNAGADLSVNDGMQQDPLFWAKYHQNQEMIQFINRHLKSHK